MVKDIKTKDAIKDVKEKNGLKNVGYFIKDTAINQKVDSIQSNEEAQSPENYANDKISMQARNTANQSKNRVKGIVEKKKIERQSKKEVINGDSFDDHHSNIKSKTNQKDIKSKKEIKRKLGIKKENIKTKESSSSGKVITHTSKKSNSANYQKRMRLTMIRKRQRVVNSPKQHTTLFKRSESAVKGTLHVIKKATTTMSNLVSMGTGLLLLVVIALFVGVFSSLGNDSGTPSSMMPLSSEVVAYQETITKYAKQYDMEQYVTLIQAVMMQESEGKGNDPMQSSECEYNEKFPKKPNGITDKEYSIDVGVHYLSECFKVAKINKSMDMTLISLALQGYNYGKGYITWAVDHFGRYTKANALVYSDEKKAQLNTNVYGDPEYVAHVLRYYHMGTGDSVQIALSQVGNGGKTYWEWYGFEKRVEWCAIFTSWVHQQSGDLNVTVPKFSAVRDGVKWYKDKGLFQNNFYMPKPGDIIFFDWKADGTVNHVGIVERVDATYIYTVEGNSNDSVKQRKYAVRSPLIYGYGIVSK